MKYILLTTFVGTIAIANPNYKDSISKLEENAQNSEHNYSEYKKNLKIVEENIKQIDKALSELKESDEKVEYHIKNSEKNKKSLVKHKTDIKALIQVEETKIGTEEKQIAELQKKLDAINKNITQRKLNIAAYKQKDLEIDKELSDWSAQQKKIVDLRSVIKEKKATADGSKKEWVSKKDGYSKETDKWKSQAASDQKLVKTYKKFD